MFGFDKIKCKSCGNENDKDNKFCAKCGTNISKTVCSGCGAQLSQGSKFCPQCGSNIFATPAQDRSEEKPVPQIEKIKMWSRQPDDFARRFELEDIQGTFRKHVTVEQGTKAIFLQGGKFFGELLPGNYDAGGLLKQIGNLNFSEKATVIIVDGSDTRLNFEIGKLRTKEAFPAGVKGSLAINIETPVMFFTNMMKSRESISVSELTGFLAPEMTNVVQSKIKQYSFDDLYGDLKIKNEIQQDFEYHMRTTLTPFVLRGATGHLVEERLRRIEGGVTGGSLSEVRAAERALETRVLHRVDGVNLETLALEFDPRLFGEVHQTATQSHDAASEVASVQLVVDTIDADGGVASDAATNARGERLAQALLVPAGG